MTGLHLKKFAAPLIPYCTVGIGLLVFHNAWLAILSYHAAILTILLLSKTKIVFKSGQNHNRKILFTAALTGSSAGIILYFLWPLFSVSGDFQNYIRSIGLFGWTWPVFIVYYSLVNPLMEEWYWRGYLGSADIRLIPGDLLFAGYHLIVLAGQVKIGWLIVIFIGLTAGAWCWRQTNRLDQSLLPSVLSHMTADIGIILVIWYIAVK
jgi:membrane protease YdiL (CAAX protease family)